MILESQLHLSSLGPIYMQFFVWSLSEEVEGALTASPLFSNSALLLQSCHEKKAYLLIDYA